MVEVGQIGRASWEEGRVQLYMHTHAAQAGGPEQEKMRAALVAATTGLQVHVCA